MTRSLSRTLAAALALALSLAALPARADGRDRHTPQPPAVALHVEYAPAPPSAWAPPPAHRAAARAGWRAERVAELRRATHRLEERRARFHASWKGNPWRRDRFEAWYAAQRAELDARWASLHGRDRYAALHGHRR